jgi:hypothetical protein
LYSNYLINEALEGFGNFKTREKVIRAVHYADDLVLMAMEEKALQVMFD